MLYRARGTKLVIERQLLDDRDVLVRLEKEIETKFEETIASIEQTKVGLRQALEVIFVSKKAARKAEKWIEKSFDV